MDPFEALGDPNRRAIVELLRRRRPLGAGARRRAPDQPARRVPPPAAAQGGGAGDRPRRRARAGSTGSTTRASRRCAPTSSRSGATRRRASASPRRTRAVTEPPRARSRSTARSSTRSSVWAERTSLWWPAGALGLGRARGGHVRAAAGRADLRAHPGRRGARLGRGRWPGSHRTGSPTPGTCARTAPTPPSVEITFAAAADGHRGAIVHRGWSGSARRAPGCASATSAGGRGAAGLRRGCGRPRRRVGSGSRSVSAARLELFGVGLNNSGLELGGRPGGPPTSPASALRATGPARACPWCGGPAGPHARGGPPTSDRSRPRRRAARRGDAREQVLQRRPNCAGSRSECISQ